VHAPHFAPVEIMPGDAVIFFNPLFYQTISNEAKETVVEHELWHVYLDNAFPKYRQEINFIAMGMAFSFRFLIANFLQPFEHFFLRSAALEAGRCDFAVRDANLQMPKQLSVVKKLDRDQMLISATCVGLLFEYFIPFIFRESKFARENLDMIRQTITGISDKAVFERSFMFANEIFRACTDRHTDPIMEDLENPVSQLWIDYIKKYAPQLL
jgi:hypothetical protein